MAYSLGDINKNKILMIYIYNDIILQETDQFYSAHDLSSKLLG